jgi:hypothetical protein
LAQGSSTLLDTKEGCFFQIDLLYTFIYTFILP